MGLIVKKDETEHEVIEGIEIIERSDTPDDLPKNPVELVQGASAEDIAAGEGAPSGASPDGDGSDGEDAAGAADAPDADDEDSNDDEPQPQTGGSDGSDTVTPGAHHGAEALAHTPRSVKIGGVVIMLVVAVVAAVAGYVIGNGGFNGAGTGSATIEEGQLDEVVATYSYNGASHNITARDAIESEYSLESAQNEDGTYTVPSSETIIQLVRNDILASEAESRGIKLSDDDLDDYAEQILGTSDYGELATQYGVSKDQAKKIVRENALIQKLYDQIVPEASELKAPTEPTKPKDGDTSAASADYAKYIIDLAGDEWDASKNAWASTDGPYYEALGDDFDGKTATYEQAVSAYYVAYQNYSSKAQELSNTYKSYVNGLFANADIRLYGLYM